MSRHNRRMREILEFSPAGEFVPGHIVRVDIPITVDDDPAEDCRACLARGHRVDGATMILGSWFCAADAAQFGFLAEVIPPTPPVMRERFCQRCCEPIRLDRERIARELELFGRSTGICSACFDQRASDTYMPEPRRA